MCACLQPFVGQDVLLPACLLPHPHNQLMLTRIGALSLLRTQAAAGGGGGATSPSPSPASSPAVTGTAESPSPSPSPSPAPGSAVRGPPLSVRAWGQRPWLCEVASPCEDGPACCCVRLGLGGVADKRLANCVCQHQVCICMHTQAHPYYPHHPFSRFLAPHHMVTICQGLRYCSGEIGGLGSSKCLVSATEPAQLMRLCTSRLSCDVCRYSVFCHFALCLRPAAHPS